MINQVENDLLKSSYRLDSGDKNHSIMFAIIKSDNIDGMLDRATFVPSYGDSLSNYLSFTVCMLQFRFIDDFPGKISWR